MPTAAPSTPSEREASKTEAARVEDIAYTINHALACTTTDFIDPYFGNVTQKYLGKRFSIGCGHDHSKDHEHGPTCDHDHGHHHHPGSHLKHWWIGEVAGDFGAVPVTVAFQRFAPGFMSGLRNVMEPVLGPLFHNGAKRSARIWAAKTGVDVESEECKQKEREIYEHEASHLPQALIWTASSIAINLTTQKLTGNDAPLWQLAAGKAVGASLSAGLVVGGRALAPQTARRWDSFTSQKLFLPATKAIGTLFGVDAQAVDRMAAKQEAREDHAWTERVTTPGATQLPQRG